MTVHNLPSKKCGITVWSRNPKDIIVQNVQKEQKNCEINEEIVIYCTRLIVVRTYSTLPVQYNNDFTL